MSAPVPGEQSEQERESDETTFVTCPVCHGHGEPQGDGSGWDGASMHTPACDFCAGRGAVPGCESVADSCHGDPEIDECACLAKALREWRRGQDDRPE